MDQNGPVPKNQDLNKVDHRQSDRPAGYHDVGIIELLKNDQRPTFLLDLSVVGSFDSTTSRLAYCNSALRGIPEVLQDVQSLYKTAGGHHNSAPDNFKEWTLKPAQPLHAKSRSLCRLFLGFTWTIVTIRNRWNVVSGLKIDALDDLPNVESHITARSSSNSKESDQVAQSPESEENARKGLDWTYPDSSFETTSHIEWVRTFDWGSTPLGDMKDWSDQLRLSINLVMSDTLPAVLYWGQDLTMIYNEAYVPTFSSKHPWGLGRPFQEVYGEVATELKDFYDSIWAHGRNLGKATAADEERFVMVMHNERCEEVFFSYTVLPVLGDDRCVGGFYAAFKDVTRPVLVARRAASLRDAAEYNVNGIDPGTFWRKLVNTLSANENDVAAIFAYSIRGLRHDASTTSAQATEATVLEAFSSVPMDDRGVPCAHNLLRKDGSIMAVFEEALRTGLPRSYDITDCILSKNLMNSGQTTNERNLPTQLAFCPTDPQLFSQGILVIAVNPLRPYDVDYQQFVAQMGREVSASLAASDRARFAEQAIIESELRFSQMTATSPAAHFEVNLEGQILYVNDRWHAITGMPRAGHEIPAMSWLHMVYEPDVPIVHGVWAQLHEGKSVSFEVRMKKDWQAINPFSGENLELEYTWVLVMASQHATKTGPTIMGCFVDINQQKWAEDFQKRKTEEAIEMKHQQERFIDMTSHEIRNPLSAIFQCSDSIVSLLEDAMRSAIKASDNDTFGGSRTNALLESLKSCIEAAQTISLCAQHQKRIVDDVLLLSKMDANMIEVNPVDSNPEQLLEHGLRIFASELRANETRMEFHVDESYRDLEVDWVRLDPSRLLQILINLTTNALKFTISEKKDRMIIVSLGASTTPPSHLTTDNAGFTYLPPSGDIIDPTLRPEWGSGDPIYIKVSVKDTGRGISEDEMKELFKRFKQASPRTHVQYGGSGLGLHISRQLTEMQGGQIGVTSERGKGSIFSFYIKARRCTPADVPLPAPRSATKKVLGRPRSLSSVTSKSQQSRSCQISQDSTPVREPLKLNILIVEDNIVNQKVLCKQLQNLGWNVTIANHGVEALNVLKDSIFWTLSNSSEHSKLLDLVLMDIEMPVMDGLTATKEIRRLQADGTIRGHVPIIAVSANARSEQIAKIKAAGMDDVVSKPFRISQLVTKIEQLLANSSSP